MKILTDVLKRNRNALLIFAIITVVNIAVFLLYDVPAEPLIYSCVVALFFIVIAVAVQLFREKRRLAELDYALLQIKANPFDLPEAESLAEGDYREMVKALAEETRRLTIEFDEQRLNALDYYTKWVHQIKTPIAVMKLKLSDDTPENRALSAELFRIEQYVDMVLQYIRFDSASNDLVIREYSLDELIRETLRKFAPLFIEKKLKLNYEPVDKTIVTDKKLFLCILEQLLSNAVKYTSQGSVTVSLEGNSLKISDTGIGIAPEDLPRIFEMGYTGNNGRIGEKSSGLGLSLCKKSADMLATSIRCESTVGQGSTFFIALPEKQI